MDGEKEYHSKGGRKAGTGGITMLGESPCDKCLHGSTYCGKNGLACQDYLHYIKKGKVRLRDRAPTRDCYMRIQASGQKKESSKKESRAQEKNRRAEKVTSEEKRTREKASTCQKAIDQKAIDKAAEAARETIRHLKRIREASTQRRLRTPHHV